MSHKTEEYSYAQYHSDRHSFIKELENKFPWIVITDDPVGLKYMCSLSSKSILLIHKTDNTIVCHNKVVTHVKILGSIGTNSIQKLLIKCYCNDNMSDIIIYE